MKVDANGDYICQDDERVQVEFFCSPSRKNVGILTDLDGEISQLPTTQNSVRFKMDRKKRVLKITYGFIQAGSCDNEITVVDNAPGGMDIVTARGDEGDVDRLTFVFKVS